MNKIACFLFLAFFTVCFFLDINVSKAEDKPEIVAKVNASVIKKVDVDFFVDRKLESLKKDGKNVTPEIEKSVRDGWLNNLIERALLLESARSNNIVVSDKEIEKSIAAALHQGVEMPPDKLREIIAETLMINKNIENLIISKVEVSDEEIRAIYEEQKDEYSDSDQVKAFQISIKTSPAFTKEEKEAARKKIEEILKKARDEKNDFSELAKKYSEDPSSVNGGHLGFFRKGQMLPEFEDVAFSLKPGEVSDIFETEFGYHIIKVDNRKEGKQIEFDDLKDELKTKIQMQKGAKKVADWIVELRKKAIVEITK
jgi:hypothetical protein